MKFQVLPLIVAASLAGCHHLNTSNQSDSSAESSNSRTSLDWAGHYKGVLPTEDFEGIFMQITLNADNTFNFTKRYFGDSDSVFTAEGLIQWMTDNNRIALHDMIFRVGENRLLPLPNQKADIPASRLTYYLDKVSPDDITDIYWRLTSLVGIEVSGLMSTPLQDPHIVLHSYNRRIHGCNSCNRIMGEYDLGDGNAIKFNQIATTRIACQDYRLERLFNTSLESVTHYQTNGSVLMLYNDQNDTMKFERIENNQL